MRKIFYLKICFLIKTHKYKTCIANLNYLTYSRLTSYKITMKQYILLLSILTIAGS